MPKLHSIESLSKKSERRGHVLADFNPLQVRNGKEVDCQCANCGLAGKLIRAEKPEGDNRWKLKGELFEEECRREQS